MKIFLICAGFIVLVYLLIGKYKKRRYKDKDFCQEQWMQDREHRFVFVKNIIETALLIGKSQEEVIKLLGDEFNCAHSQNWSYSIGVKSFFYGGFNPRKQLHIKFNEKKRVYRVL